MTTSTENTELDDLAYTRSKRKQIIEHITAKGIPEDVKMQSILLQSLDGMDRAALGKMKIKSDEGVSSAQLAAAAIMATIFNDPRVKTIGKTDSATREVPILDTSLPQVELVEGELDIDPKGDSFEAFAARTGL